MKYSLGYDYMFLAWDSFMYDGELIGGMSLDVLFHITDKNGEEVYFENMLECIDKPIAELKNIDQLRNKVYLYDLYQCSYDKDEEFVFTPTKHMKYFPCAGISIEIMRFYKDLKEGCSFYPVEISEAEFRKIIKEHPENFDNSDNISAQTGSYFYRECDIPLTMEEILELAKEQCPETVNDFQIVFNEKDNSIIFEAGGYKQIRTIVDLCVAFVNEEQTNKPTAMILNLCTIFSEMQSIITNK